MSSNEDYEIISREEINDLRNELRKLKHYILKEKRNNDPFVRKEGGDKVHHHDLEDKIEELTKSINNLIKIFKNASEITKDDFERKTTKKTQLKTISKSNDFTALLSAKLDSLLEQNQIIAQGILSLSQNPDNKNLNVNQKMLRNLNSVKNQQALYNQNVNNKNNKQNLVAGMNNNLSNDFDNSFYNINNNNLNDQNSQNLKSKNTQDSLDIEDGNIPPYKSPFKNQI
jgi:hypothetical protein